MYGKIATLINWCSRLSDLCFQDIIHIKCTIDITIYHKVIIVESNNYVQMIT